MSRKSNNRKYRSGLMTASVLAMGMALSGLAVAQDIALDAIVIDGNIRIEEATILSYAGIAPGGTITAGQANDALRRLQDTGLFETVDLRLEGNTVFIELQEYPTINVISIEGNDLLDDDALSALLTSQPRRVYSPAIAEADAQAIVDAYRQTGRLGVFGLLQTVADALKYVVKEVVIPAGADRAVFMLAPLTSFVLALIAWAVIPFNDTWVLSDINVAILYVFAVSSLEVYGVIMGGWASNSKYPFLGSLRSAAQMISYEVSIGLIIIGVIISTGSMNFSDIVRAQDGDYGFFSWYWLPHFPMVFLFFISALAETNRPPFDLPEAESELVAGYQVEYSSTPFLLFMAGEYIAIFLMCALTTLLFFGGWLSPIPGIADGAIWMVAKMAFFFFIFAMVKAITPRYRYDQLMRLGWKVFLPFSLVWVVLVSFAAKFELFGGAYARWAIGG